MLSVTLLSPASAAPTVDVRPLPLPVGERPTVPFLDRAPDGSLSVVDPRNDTTTPVENVGDDTDEFDLLGRAGDGFVLRGTNRDIDDIVRVQPGAPQRLLAHLHYSSKARVSSDGRYLLDTVPTSSGGIRVQVRSATTGAGVAQHVFKASTRPDPIDVRGTVVLVGGFNTPRTMVWDWNTGTIETIATRAAYEGSFATDRLATYTTDPSDPDACTVVSTISAPRSQLWRGCVEAVASFAPDGARFATNAIEHQNHADVVRRRSLHGTLLTTYTNPDGLWMYAWETNTRIQMRSAGTGESWLVRCEVADCERSWRSYH